MYAIAHPMRMITGLAYSDIEHAYVMHKASIALTAGADFSLLGPNRTMLRSKLPVVAVCAVRTGD